MRPRSKSVSASVAPPIEVDSGDDSDDSNADYPQDQKSAYSAEDQIQLLCKVKEQVPDKDNLPFNERLKRIDWSLINLENFTAQEAKDECKRMVSQSRQFRILDEIVRENHADVLLRLPIEKPKPIFALFLMDNREKIEKLAMGGHKGHFTKIASQLFSECSEKEREKLRERSNLIKMKYEEAMKNYSLPKFKKKKAVKVKRELQARDTPCELYVRSSLLRDPNASRSQLRKEYIDLAKGPKLKWILRWAGLQKRQKANLEQYLRMTKTLNKLEKDIYDEYEGRPTGGSVTAYNIYMREQLNKKSNNGTYRENFKSSASDWKSLPIPTRAEYKIEAKRIRKNFAADFARFVHSLPADRQEYELNAQDKKNNSVGNNASQVNTTVTNTLDYSDDSELDEDDDGDGETIFECNTGVASSTKIVYTADDNEHTPRKTPAKRKTPSKDEESTKKKMKLIYSSSSETDTGRTNTRSQLKFDSPKESLPSTSKNVKKGNQLAEPSLPTPLKKKQSDKFKSLEKVQQASPVKNAGGGFKKFTAKESDHSDAEIPSKPSEERLAELRQKYNKIKTHRPHGTLLEFYAHDAFDGNVKLAKKSLKKLSETDKQEWIEKYDQSQVKYKKKFRTFSERLTPEEITALAQEINAN